MADCMFHGYSGGPGGCTFCEEEARKGQERGSIKEGYDMSVTTSEWSAGRYTRDYFENDAAYQQYLEETSKK